MSAPSPARTQHDESILIDNVNASGLTLGLFGVIGLAWTFQAAGAGAHGWMIVGMVVAALALLAGLIGMVIERPRARRRKQR